MCATAQSCLALCSKSTRIPAPQAFHPSVTGPTAMPSGWVMHRARRCTCRCTTRSTPCLCCGWRWNAAMTAASTASRPKPSSAMCGRAGPMHWLRSAVLRTQLSAQLRTDEQAAERAKALLRSNTEEASAAGLFGVPSLAFDERVFLAWMGCPCCVPACRATAGSTRGAGKRLQVWSKACRLECLCHAHSFTFGFPFDCLTPDEQALVRNSVDIAYFPEGAAAGPGCGAHPSFVIIKGHVEQTEGEQLLASYGPEDCFDGRALVAAPAAALWWSRSWWPISCRVTSSTS